MRVKVQEAKWNNKVCYLGFMSFNNITKIVKIKKDLAMNRQVKQDRVEKIVKYINENVETVFFPPVVLNSCEKIITDDKYKLNNEIELNYNSLTIIDGQHRISAIKQSLLNNNFADKLKEKKLPFLLIENLDANEHRNLFNLINETATNVEATVSARFKISYENMYGLRIVKNNLEKYKNHEVDYCIKDAIEWEIKQSQEKICYLFITEMNKIFLRYIDKNIIDSDDGNSYMILEHFWIRYFKFIISLSSESEVECNIKSFYVKKITIRSIVDAVLGNIEDCYTNKCSNYETLKAKINTVLDDLLTRNFLEQYSGPCRQGSDTYKEIIGFLVDNTEDINNSIEAKEAIIEGNDN